MKIFSLVGARSNFMKIACCGTERQGDREMEGRRD